MTLDPAPVDHPPEYHNPVLTRSHEPARANHAWVAIIPAIIAIVAGVAIWTYVSTHGGTVVNHAVAAAPTAPSGWHNGGG